MARMPPALYPPRSSHGPWHNFHDQIGALIVYLEMSEQAAAKDPLAALARIQRARTQLDRAEATLLGMIPKPDKEVEVA